MRFIGGTWRDFTWQGALRGPSTTA